MSGFILQVSSFAQDQAAPAEQNTQSVTPVEPDPAKTEQINKHWQQTLVEHSMKAYQKFISDFESDPLAANELEKAKNAVEKLQNNSANNKQSVSDTRFVDLNDGTVMDRKSGLLWAKKDSYADTNKCLNFDEAYNYVSNLRTGGYSDWQIPSLEELETLYDDKSFIKAFDHQPVHFNPIFELGCSWWFWTSSDGLTTTPTVKDFIHGDVGRLDQDYCSGGGVRAARFGKTFAIDKPVVENPGENKELPEKNVRFVDNNNGTVTDTKTGYMWTVKGSYVDLGKCLNFNQATEYVHNLQTGGYSDWTIPSLEQLGTLYDQSLSSTSFDNKKIHLSPVFTPNGAWWFWTSDEADTGQPFVKDFVGGETGKLNADYCDGGGVRAIRQVQTAE